MGKLHSGPIHISPTDLIPWHEHNIGIHLEYLYCEKTTILTLYTKDHKKVVRLTNEEYHAIKSSNERNNWALYQRRKWQLELRALYVGLGD